MAKGKAYSKQSVKKTGRERKEKLVAEITEKLDSSNGLVFTDYKGITHQQMETLRKELKSVDASLLIAKNSLMNISLGKSKSFADFKDNENLAGSAATLFIGSDTIEPLKKLQKSIKDTGLPTIKFGILEGQLLDEAGVVKLASLPTREVLLTQFVGMLNAPIQGFVTGLNAIPRKFVMTLDAIAKNKPANDSAVESDADTTTDEPSKTEPTPNPDKPPTPAPEEPQTGSIDSNEPQTAEDINEEKPEQNEEKSKETQIKENKETEEPAEQTSDEPKIDDSKAETEENTKNS